MSLKILQYPNVSLQKTSLEIEKITQDICSIAKKMVKTMYNARGVGLAAPQVGYLIRLIVVDVSGPEQQNNLMILINPNITPVVEAGFIEEEEGCLSVPDYRSKVKRYAKVLLDAIDLDNNAVSFEAEGLLSVCLQHEVDHLDGKLFIDRVSYLKRKLYDSRLKKKLLKNAI